MSRRDPCEIGVGSGEEGVAGGWDRGVPWARLGML